MWLNAEAAAELVGRTTRSIRTWDKKGWLITAIDHENHGGKKVYDRGSLLVAKQKASENYDGRGFIAGPGRGKKGVAVKNEDVVMVPVNPEAPRPEVVEIGEKAEMSYLELQQEIRDRVRVVESGCWEWQRATNGVTGYGVFGIGGRRYAHRGSWEAFNEQSIPDGMEIDHRCRNRSCVNPGHLDVVTHQENSRRRKPLSDEPRKQRRSTGVQGGDYCGAGHVYDGGNTYVSPKGGRTCRTCARAAAARSNVRYRRAKESGSIEPQDGFNVGGYSGSGEADQTHTPNHSVLGGARQGQPKVCAS